MDIAKRASSDLSLNHLSATKDAAQIPWTPCKFLATNFTELPSKYQSALTQENLVPTQILMEVFSTVSDSGEVTGWFIGRDSFSNFSIDVESSIARGARKSFTKDAVIKKSTLSSDISDAIINGTNQPQPTKPEIELGIAVLPATLRRMFLSIINPDFHDRELTTLLTDNGSTMILEFNGIVANKNKMLAVNAIQKVIGEPGSTEKALLANISRAPWQVRITSNDLK